LTAEPFQRGSKKIGIPKTVYFSTSYERNNTS